MNEQGDIKEFKSTEEAKAEGYDKELTPEESKDLMVFDSDIRLIRLHFLRFWDTQKKFRVPSDKNTMWVAWLQSHKNTVRLIGEDLEKNPT